MKVGDRVKFKGDRNHYIIKPRLDTIYTIRTIDDVNKEDNTNNRKLTVVIRGYGNTIFQSKDFKIVNENNKLYKRILK